MWEASVGAIWEFYESVDWHTLRPVNFVAHGFSFTERNDLLGRPLFTANDDMSIVVGYFSQKSAKAATIATLPYKSYLVRWFDPKTGEYTTVDADARPVKGRWSLPMNRSLFAASPEDKVLVLTANK